MERGKGAPHVPPDIFFKKVVYKNGIKHENRDHLDFIKTQTNPLKRICQKTRTHLPGVSTTVHIFYKGNNMIFRLKKNALQFIFYISKCQRVVAKLKVALKKEIYDMMT